MFNQEHLFYSEPEFDQSGFLEDPLSWDESMARIIARNDGVELTPDHWLIIHSLRTHYFTYGAVPPMFAHLCVVNHLGKHCIDHLFTSQREAWRIAGLPDPGEEAKAYM